MSSETCVEGGGSLRGVVRVPGDKSISHRALLFNALAHGRATISGLLESEDVHATADCLRALGVSIENGQVVGAGFSGKRSQLGVRTTAAVKKLGCSNLKTMLEDDKIIVCDYDIISELTTFAQKHNSFEAEEGCNDDLAMCLVIFSWLVAQDYFKEMTDNDVRKRIYEEQKNQIEQDMAPFGFISDGFDNDTFVDEDGDLWKTDEYGDRSYMWDYY